MCVGGGKNLKALHGLAVTHVVALLPHLCKSQRVRKARWMWERRGGGGDRGEDGGRGSGQ